MNGDTKTDNKIGGDITVDNNIAGDITVDSKEDGDVKPDSNIDGDINVERNVDGNVKVDKKEPMATSRLMAILILAARSGKTLPSWPFNKSDSTRPRGGGSPEKLAHSLRETPTSIVEHPPSDSKKFSAYTCE